MSTEFTLVLNHSLKCYISKYILTCTFRRHLIMLVFFMFFLNYDTSCLLANECFVLVDMLRPSFESIHISRVFQLSFA